MLNYSVLLCLLIALGQSQSHQDQSSHRGQSLSSVEEQLASQGVSGHSQSHLDKSLHQGKSLSTVDEQLASQGVSEHSHSHRDQSSHPVRSLYPVDELLASRKSQDHQDKSLHRDQTLFSINQQLANSARAKPCRRRNNNENSDQLFPDASWVKKLQSQSVYPLNQKVTDENYENLRQETRQPLNGHKVPIQPGHNKPVQKDLSVDEIETPLVLKSRDIEDLLEDEDELCQNLDENDNYTESDEEQNNLNADNKQDSDQKLQEQALALLAKCVQKVKYANDNENERNTRRSNNQSTENKPGENSYAYEPSNSNEIKRKRKFRNKQTNSNEVDVQPKHPAQGEGILSLAESRGVLLLQNSRVCFACTTANDPSCWNPDHTTTVKYCKKEDDACITKTFKANNELITIRDCGNSCTDSDVSGVPLRYKSCRICHSDQCNGAAALSGLSMLLVAFFITAVKFTF